MPKIGMQNAVKTSGVLARAIASIGAVPAVPHLQGPGGLDKGVVIEILCLASAFLPQEQAGIFGYHILDPVCDLG